jgi:NADH-quinone oxidoreductase subunit K
MIIINDFIFYESLCFLLFFISLIGVIYTYKNLIINLIFIELGFLSINLLLIIFSWFYNNIYSHIIIIYILSLTAIETAVGLALFILYYKTFKSIDTEDFYIRKI